jgi:secreted PhoX family phosphatase
MGIFLSMLAALSVCGAVEAQFSNYTPLASSAGPTLDESMPLTLSSPLFAQQSIADRANQNTLHPGSDSGAWDMIVANETGSDAGRFLFSPYETNTAGVFRVDLNDPNYNTRTVTIVAPGTLSFVAGDMAKWAPWGGFLTAEESWGVGSDRGRLFEVTDPTTAAANSANFVARTVIPRVSHEGLQFDASRAMYFIDELNGGSIYKYESAMPNATSGDDFFMAGQTSVLRVGAGGQFEGNNGPAITGAFTWIPITDASGGPLAGVSVLAADAVSIDGRATADVAAVLGTGYNRPEDTEYKVLSNGDEALFFTTTDSDDNANTTDGRSRVYLLNITQSTISLFADSHTTDLATGLTAEGGWRNADNLAIDNEGNLYMIEDRNGSVDDDIWFLNDINHDGDLLDAGEGVGRWASNGTPGSELTGLYFDRFDSTKAYVNVQHPTSLNDRMIEISVVPEPATFGLLGIGLVFAAPRRRRG